MRRAQTVHEQARKALWVRAGTPDRLFPMTYKTARDEHEKEEPRLSSETDSERN